LPTYPFERQRYWFAETPATDENKLAPDATSPENERLLVHELEDQPSFAEPISREAMLAPTVAETNGQAVYPPATITEQVIRQQLQLMQQQLELWRR
jgi:hypothetical protein